MIFLKIIICFLLLIFCVFPLVQLLIFLIYECFH